MKTLSEALYYTRIILFVIHFFLLFLIIDTMVHLGLLFYIFLFVYILYIINIIMDFLEKNKKSKTDLIYNFMQIGVYFYIAIICYRVKFSHIYVNNDTFLYFIINFSILMFLFIFIMIYGKLEIKSHDKLVKKKK